MEQVIEVDDTNFHEEVLQAKLPVLVDFWAEWCGPCRMIGPLVGELAVERVGQVKVCKMNVDHSPATPSKYGIRGIPTLIIFKNGLPHATKVGALTKLQLDSFIDENC